MFRGRYRNRGGGSSSRGRGGSAGAHSTRLRGLFADGIWHCDCTPRLPAEHFKVKKEGANKGRWFYTCQNQEPKRCGFFLWDEDAKPREEAAVLSNSRTEPGGRNVAGDAQEGWNAGRQQATPAGRGLFAGLEQQQQQTRDPEETDSPTPSPPPPYSSPSKVPSSSAVKRTARDAQMDDEDQDFFPWPLTGQEEHDLAKATDGAAAPETPHKAQKTGVYATPATTGKRKLPWLEQPTTPATSSVRPTNDYFQTPTRATAPLAPVTEHPLETPKPLLAPATAKSPSPPSRYKDALTNPADSASSLTSETLATLSSTNIPPDVISYLRSILSKHDLKTQGIIRGRDISRLALKARDAKIAELQKKIESLQADMELDRSVMRQLRWQAEHGQRSEGEGP
ncbi:hypothetical protein LTR85_008567 [Meristemomyces frigidus]|nr:hypothetical protein LTR85_008567 [Meristemomyces frigidus]